MDNAISQLLNAGDRDARVLLGTAATFAHRGQAYATANVISSAADSELVFAAGGAELRVTAAATVRKDALPHAPAEGDSLTLSGVRFYVAQVSTSPHDPLYHLALAN